MLGPLRGRRSDKAIHPSDRAFPPTRDVLSEKVKKLIEENAALRKQNATLETYLQTLEKVEVYYKSFLTKLANWLQHSLSQESLSVFTKQWSLLIDDVFPKEEPRTIIDYVILVKSNLRLMAPCLIKRPDEPHDPTGVSDLSLSRRSSFSEKNTP